MNKDINKTKWYSLAGIWFGGIVSVPALLIGSSLIVSMRFKTAIIAGILGFGFVAFFMSLLSIAAVEKRKPTVSLASSSFGRNGAAIMVSLVIGLSTLGWFGIQTGIAAASFNNILMQMDGPVLPEWLAASFWGMIMVLTAVFGFKYLKWLNYIAVPAMILLLIYGLIITFQDQSFHQILNFVPESKITLLQAIGFTIGFISVGGVIAPDYNRFALSKKDAVLGSVLGVVPSALSLLAIGAILAISKGTHDIVEIFTVLGMPFLAMSILILATWTSNVMNIYSSGLAFNSLLRLSEKKRSRTTLILGIFGILFSTLGILDHFMKFISLLTITITPIAGVMISDFFIAKKFSDSPSRYNWSGIFSWGIGVFIMVAMTEEIKNILGIVFSGLTYYLWHIIERSLNKYRLGD